MKAYTAHHVRYHAHRVQEWAFYAAVIPALAFIGFALAEHERYAMSAAILGAVAIGVSVGAWIVANHFED